MYKFTKCVFIFFNPPSFIFFIKIFCVFESFYCYLIFFEPPLFFAQDRPRLLAHLLILLAGLFYYLNFNKLWNLMS